MQSPPQLVLGDGPPNVFRLYFGMGGAYVGTAKVQVTRKTDDDDMTGGSVLELALRRQVPAAPACSKVKSTGGLTQNSQVDPAV
jgi:hypothetical protein